MPLNIVTVSLNKGLKLTFIFFKRFVKTRIFNFEIPGG